jgi:hypothetical protein
VKVFKVVGIVIGVVILLAGVYAWGSLAARRKTYGVHTLDFPIPFPSATQ